MEPIRHCPVPLTDTAWRRLLSLAQAEWRSPASQAGLMLAASLGEAPAPTQTAFDDRGSTSEGRLVVRLGTEATAALREAATLGHRSPRIEAARILEAALLNGAKAGAKP